MQIRLLSFQSSTSRAGQLRSGAPAEATGHPHHLPHDLSAALRENGHEVEIDLLGDTLDGHDLTTLREGATAGRAIAAGLRQAGCVLHALDPIAWAAALTARSLTDVAVVLRFSEPALADGTGRRGTDRARDPGLRSGPESRLGTARDSGGGSGRVSTIGSATERRAYRACLRSADAIAAADDRDRLAAVRAGVPGRRALIVPDVVGLPIEQPRPTLLQPGPNLLSLSGIGPDSGIDTLLAALRWVPDRNLVVIGPGNDGDAAALRAGLERSGLTGRVHWLGRLDREDAVRLIDAAALVVLPGPTTGATGAVEAMARSRAVATVAGGPAADVVVDGITGAVLPAGRPDLLGQALRALLKNPFQLEAMGLAGQERALTRYARDRAVSATEQAYRVALGAA